MKHAIITADDFGISFEVNDAIEQSHRNGILTSASLMVGERASANAVERAQKLPSLAVGLHVVLVQGQPILPPHSIPDLVGSNGHFHNELVGPSFSFFFRPRVQAQLEAEIRAQFEAFRATGLVLDHVNCHNHMHMHPTVFDLIISIGSEFGLQAIRVPHEPFLISWQSTHEDIGRRLANDFFLQPFVWSQRKKIRLAKMTCNDYIFGLNDTGGMNRKRMLEFLANLPEGVSEIYCHPATESRDTMNKDSKCCSATNEFSALTDPSVKAAFSQFSIVRTTYGALSKHESG